ncbi:MAG: PIN domain-containing protein [Chitinivorax sp.]
MIRLVIDTSVFVTGLRSAGGAARMVLRRALSGDFQPLFGNALWQEYCDLLGRDVWGAATTSQERSHVGWATRCPREKPNRSHGKPWGGFFAPTNASG